MENEQGRYLFVDVRSCDVSNNQDPEDLDPEHPDERGTINYYLAPLPQFEVIGLHG